MTAVSGLTAAGLFGTIPKKSPEKILKTIGIQLFSLPMMLSTDFPGTIKMISDLGYKEVELYGPFPFSTEAAKMRWATITPSLGFEGSGYFGHSAREVRNILDDHGIKTPAIHTDLETMQVNMDQLSEAASILGFTYIGLPAIPEEKRKTMDDYKRIADDFNGIGEKAKNAGLKFTYHNHGYGLQETDGKVPMKIILDNTEPDLVFLEMDVYWTTAGGADPIDYLTSYPGRYHLIHLKDMKEPVRFKGDGGNPSEWIALFPYMTSAGKGILDLEQIIIAAKSAGVKHFLVEQDMVESPEVALKQSFDYLAGL